MQVSVERYDPESPEAARSGGLHDPGNSRGLFRLEAGMEGWAPLFRSLLKSPIRRNPRLFSVYVNCILEASWKERDVEWETPYGVVKVHLLPGQCVFGDRRWSAELGIPHATLSRCVTRLEGVSKVRREVRRGYSIISVPELETYYAQGVTPETRSETPLRRGRDEGEKRVRPQEEGNNGTKKQSKKKTNGSAYAPPSWVPPSEWSAWLEVRRKKRAPNTDHAMELAVKELEKLKAQGHDPAKVLNQSTFRGWQGLFPPRDELMQEFGRGGF